MEKLEQLLSVTSVEFLQDYFSIRLIVSKLPSLTFPVGITIPESMTAFSFGPVSTEQIINIFRAPTVKDSVIKTPEQKCADETSKSFKYIIGRFFTLVTFGAVKEKKDVEELANDISDAWRQDIKLLPGLIKRQEPR